MYLEEKMRMIRYIGLSLPVVASAEKNLRASRFSG